MILFATFHYFFPILSDSRSTQMSTLCIRGCLCGCESRKREKEEKMSTIKTLKEVFVAFGVENEMKFVFVLLSDCQSRRHTEPNINFRFFLDRYKA